MSAELLRSVWPALGRKVEIRIPGDPRWLGTKVTDRDELLTLAAPALGGAPMPEPAPGAVVAVRWTERRGIGLLDALVAGTQYVPEPLWHLRVMGEGELVQRRRYARVPISLPGEALPAAIDPEARFAEPWPFVTLDLSEGGMRATATAGPFLIAGPDDRYQLSFAVDGREVSARARVVRCAVAGNAMVVTFCFTDIARHHGDHLRRYVFARELRLRDALR